MGNLSSDAIQVTDRIEAQGSWEVVSAWSWYTSLSWVLFHQEAAICSGTSMSVSSTCCHMQELAGKLSGSANDAAGKAKGAASDAAGSAKGAASDAKGKAQSVAKNSNLNFITMLDLPSPQVTVSRV